MSLGVEEGSARQLDWSECQFRVDRNVVQGRIHKLLIFCRVVNLLLS